MPGKTRLQDAVLIQIEGVTDTTSHTSHMAQIKMKLHKWAKLPIKEI